VIKPFERWHYNIQAQLQDYEKIDPLQVKKDIQMCKLNASDEQAIDKKAYYFTEMLRKKKEDKFIKFLIEEGKSLPMEVEEDIEKLQGTIKEGQKWLDYIKEMSKTDNPVQSVKQAFIKMGEAFVVPSSILSEVERWKKSAKWQLQVKSILIDTDMED